MSLFDLAWVVDTLSSGSYTVKREAAGSIVDGRYVPGSVSEFLVFGSLQPLSGRDLELLPEGDRTSQLLKFYTATELYPARPEASTRGDVLVAEGGEFEVTTVEPWDDLGTFYKVLLTRKGA